MKGKSIVFFSLFLITLTPLLCRWFLRYAEPNLKNEMYDSSLKRLSSVEKVNAYCDSILGINDNIPPDTVKYVSVLSKIIKQRFYHGSLNYTPSENWIAWLCGKLAWSHFSSIVIADDILKHEHGLCSQQTIVFIECLRKKNIPFRTIGLGFDEGPGHFLCEVAYGGSWHLHDVSLEPLWSAIKEDHRELDYYLNNRDTLYKVYEGKITHSVFDKIFSRVHYGDVNRVPASNMKFFHRVTLVITFLLPLLFLFLFFRSMKKNRVTSTEEIFTAVEKKSTNHLQQKQVQ